MSKKVFVSGCYDMLHSGHIAFFQEAASLQMAYAIWIVVLVLLYPVCAAYRRLFHAAVVT